MQELEAEDDLLSKVPVRYVRHTASQERCTHCQQEPEGKAYEGIRRVCPPTTNTVSDARYLVHQWRVASTDRDPQAAQCTLEIYALGRSVSTLHSTTRSHGGFQDNGYKYLHYVDSPAKFEVRSGLEDLPDRIEIAVISHIATGTCTPPSSAMHDHVDLPTSQMPSPLSFSLLTANERSLADQIATDPSTWADWTDGLNMLRRDGGHVTSDETAGYIKALTEIGLKIKLLGTYPSYVLLVLPSLNVPLIADLTGEKVDIPSGLVAGPPPSNTDFFFSDLL